ncbi:MAG: PAS domain S-box protein [Acetobacterales bacterium]
MAKSDLRGGRIGDAASQAARMLSRGDWEVAYVASTDAAIFVRDIHGTILNWNRGAERLYGYSAEEIAGRDVSILIAPEHAEASAIHRQTINAIPSVTRGDRLHRRKDGTVFWAEFETAPILDGEGRIVRLVVVNHDAGPRKVTELGLRWHHALIDTTADAIIGRELDGTIRSWNKGAERLYGYAAGEMIGRRTDDLVPPGQREEMAAFRRRVNGGEIIENYETWRLRKDGTRFEVALSAGPVYDEQGRQIGVSVTTRDITVAKAALRQARWLGDVVEWAAEAVMSRGLDRNIRSWNRAAERLFGWTAGEMIGRPTSFLVPEDQRDASEARAVRVNAGELFDQVEALRYRKDGAPVWVEISSAPIYDEAGVRIGAVVTYNDIGRRKLAEAETRRLSTIVANASDAIYTRTLEGAVLTWNEGAERMLGYSAAEVVGQPFERFMPPELAAGWRERRDALNAGAVLDSFESLRLHRDGRRIPVSASSFPIREGDRIVGVAGIFRDISAQKRAEAEMRRLATVAETSPDAIYTRTPDGTILSWNRGAEAILGWSPEEIVGRGTDLIIPEDVYADTAHRRESVNAGQTIAPYESVRLHKDGRRLPVSISLSPVMEGERVVAVATVCRDISEQKAAEQALRQSTRELAERMKELRCLYEVSRIVTGTGRPVTEAVQDIANVLPAGMQYPARCHARITIGGDVRVSPGFIEAVAVVSRPLVDAGETVGRIELFFTRREDRAVDAVLEQEREMVEEVARRLGAYLRRRRIEDEQRLLAQIVESSEDAIYSRDPDMRITSWNKAAERLFGWSAEEVVGQPLRTIYPPGGYEVAYRTAVQVNRGIARRTEDTRRMHKDGHIVHISASAAPILDEHGTVIGAAISCRDISGHRAAEAQKTLLASIVESSGDAIYSRTLEGHVTSWNKAAEELFGYTWEELGGIEFWDLFVPLGPVQSEDFAHTLNRGEPVRNVETRIRRSDGALVPVTLNAAPLRDPAGAITGVCGVVRDISEQKLAAERLRHLAFYDQLVQLPNRYLFEDRLDQAIRRAVRHGNRMAFHFIDLDLFKEVNDSLGHEAGDTVLKQVAERLSAALRSSDTVGRLGGDEFGVIQNDVVDIENIEHVARKLLDEVVRPFMWNGKPINIGASIGIATYPPTYGQPFEEGQDYRQELMRRADIAMYEAKSAGRRGFSFYEAAMGGDLHERMMLRESLRTALADGEFELNFQPQVNIADGRVVGAEALLRWDHPELGRQSPAMFIPIAEESGLIVPIGEWVLRDACAELRRWRDAGNADVVVSVNVSAVQLRRREFVGQVRRALEDHGIPAERLELELTESVLAEREGPVQQSIEALHRLGVRLAIDDFGTGYASFDYLKRLPIDVVKIDQSFVRGMNVDSSDASIVHSIVLVGKALGLEVIAEGVETAEHERLLLAEGCTRAQGYHYSRPVPAAEIRKAMEAGLCAPAVVSPDASSKAADNADGGQDAPGNPDAARRGDA